MQFSSAVDFLTNYEPKYDVVFMDIDMPYLDGMSAARKLRELDEQTCLVFVTSLAQFAVIGYEVAAFDFIVKPFTYSNLCLKLQRLFRHLSTHTEREIIIRTEGNMARVAIEDILYVEITGHRIVYHTKSREIASYGTLKSVGSRWTTRFSCGATSAISSTCAPWTPSATAVRWWVETNF